MSEEYITEILANKCEELEVNQSVKFLDPFCPDLSSPALPTTVLQDIGLHLECDDDGNFSVPADASNNSVLSHSVIGHNVHLRVSFPLPKTTEQNAANLKCSFCESKFKKHSKLAKHLLEIHKIVKNFQCSDCTFGTTSLRMLRRHHVRKHSKKKETESWTDKLMGGSSLSKPSHGDHPQEDVTEKTFSLHASVLPEDPFAKSVDSKELILDCGDVKETVKSKIATDAFDLTKIKEPKSANAKFVFMCHECPFKATSKHDLHKHFMSIHNSRKETFNNGVFMCEQKQTGLSLRKKHNPQKCEICQKEFLSVSSLKRHAFSHRTGRDFVCSFKNCGKEFKNPQSLQSHVYKSHKKSQKKVSDGESQQNRPPENEAEKKKSTFVCTWSGCGKSFRDNHNLKAHLCTHTGETPIKCPHCAFRCIQKASLICHMKKMHK